MENMIEIKGKQVSEDTIVEALRKHIGFEKKKKFEPIDIGRTTIAVRDGSDYPIVIQVSDYGSKSDREEYNLDARPYNYHCVEYARNIIKALQSAIDYIENK